MRAQAFAEIVDMAGALHILWADVDSLVPRDPLWYEWNHLPADVSARRDSMTEAHSRRLMSIVAEHGLPPRRNLRPPVEAAVLKAARRYPVLPNIPFIASSAAYILWRYSVDAPTQRRILPLYLEAIPRNVPNALKKHGQIMSLVLKDRVSIRIDSVQVYGTHMCEIDGQATYFPIRDPAYADERRAEAHMRLLEDHLYFIRREYPNVRRSCPPWVRSRFIDSGS